MDINTIVETGGFLYFTLHTNGVMDAELIADISEVYGVSKETATDAFGEILRQWDEYCSSREW